MNIDIRNSSEYSNKKLNNPPLSKEDFLRFEERQQQVCTIKKQ
jgi:hypothetical protein